MGTSVIRLSDKYVWNKSKCCIGLASRYPDAPLLDVMHEELGDMVLMFKNCIVRTPKCFSGRYYHITFMEDGKSCNFDLSDNYISDTDMRASLSTFFFTLNWNERVSIPYFHGLMHFPKGLLEYGRFEFGLLPKRAKIMYDSLYVMDGCVFVYGMWCLVFDNNWRCVLLGVFDKSFIKNGKWEIHIHKIIHCASNEITKRIMLRFSL